MPAVAKPPASQPPGKNPPGKNPPGKNPPRKNSKKHKRKNSKKKKLKPRTLKLKGWLKTAEDWAKFDAWAKVNALPRKLPEPEPIDRPKKPLSHFRKRIKILSKPRPTLPDPCVKNEVSINALCYRASKRINALALPVINLEALKQCKQPGVKPSALCYEPTEHIIELSMPRLRLDATDCRAYCVSKSALKHKTNEKDEELSRPKRYTSCDSGLDGRPRRPVPLSEWMEFLTIPRYMVLKDLDSDQAKEWKEKFLSEMETRGKQALEEQMKKREEEERKKGKKPCKASCSKNQQDENEDEEGEGEEEEDEEAKKKRKMEREYWRYVDHKCQPFPPKIKKAALNYEATPQTAKLAEPKKYKGGKCKDPFKVNEKALCATATPQIEELAKPKYKCDPVERPPPRELDEFGAPIFPKPEYGKKLPPTKPYPEKECKKCKEDEEGKDDECKEKEEEEKIPIDPIAFAPTIDPLHDPRGAAKQKRERKRAKEEAEKEKQKKEQAETEKSGEATGSDET